MDDQEREVNRLLDHLTAAGLPVDVARPQAVSALREAMAPKHSPTFRAGQSGGWREHFTPTNVRTFKHVTGDLLIRLGYEEDDDWG